MKSSEFRVLPAARLAILLTVAGLLSSSLAFPERGPNATSSRPAYYRAKNDPAVSAWSADVIARIAKNNRAHVWVYFTDKGFTDEHGFAAAVSRQNVALSARASARRMKVGRDRVEFEDLPVRGEYVDRVIALGGQLRQTSRWFNAASYDLDVRLLPALSALPFVQRIDPVIGFKRTPEPETAAPPQLGTPLRKPSGSAAPDVLTYGTSLGQLQQLNVPAVHNLGFKGQGVIVCMMDTGFRKDHVAFANAFAEGRVLAEYDFIFHDNNTQDEAIDQPGQHSHGSYTWSTLGGQADGSLYGPAFLAQFVLAKTEDIRSETPIEEDNWVAGMEWADALGAEVISSSLGYTDWYTYPVYNGDSAVTTKAADRAAALGIVVCNSMGNAGPGAGTMGAPADADSILSIGAVQSNGLIASFSSRGPTYDGRIKPEVCAQGYSTYCANPTSTTGYTFVSGTSLSCPLAGGCAAVVLSAHPSWTPMKVREALMMTASQHSAPDNTYGWGIIDLKSAINYTFGQPWTPGDMNYDGGIDVLDIVAEIDTVFRNLPPPEPPATPDINQDGLVNVVDVVYLIDYSFNGGPPPPTPV